MNVGLDASRCLSGGSISHLQSLTQLDVIERLPFDAIYIWIPAKIQSHLPHHPKIYYKKLGLFESNLFLQLLWQLVILPLLLKRFSCRIIFNVDSSTLCNFQPSLTLNQDLLSIDESALKLYPLFTLQRLRLYAIRLVQLYRIRSSTATIFLSSYALSEFERHVKVPAPHIIPHSFSPSSQQSIPGSWHKGLSTKLKPTTQFRLLYVSNIAYYKHQHRVLLAAHYLRSVLGYELTIDFVGGGSDSGYIKRFLAAQSILDPDHSFSRVLPFVSRAKVFGLLDQADIFVFASSCEAFGITLLEALYFGLPTVCSSLSSLQEVAGDSVLYFNPFDTSSLIKALCTILEDQNLYRSLSTKARERSRLYAPPSMAYNTWELLSRVANDT